jgi:hypothetical protein
VFAVNNDSTNDNQTALARRVERLERRCGRWTWGGLTAVAVGVVAALASGQAPQPRQALAQGQAQARSYSYSQAVTEYTRLAEVLNERNEQGWEPFQIVPIADPSNAHFLMKVAIVFRRPAAPK